MEGCPGSAQRQPQAPPAKDGTRSSSRPAVCPLHPLCPPASPTHPTLQRQYLAPQLWEAPTNSCGQSVGAWVTPFSSHFEMEMRDSLVTALGRSWAPWGLCTLQIWAEETLILGRRCPKGCGCLPALAWVGLTAPLRQCHSTAWGTWPAGKLERWPRRSSKIVAAPRAVSEVAGGKRVFPRAQELDCSACRRF